MIKLVINWEHYYSGAAPIRDLTDISTSTSLTRLHSRLHLGGDRPQMPPPQFSILLQMSNPRRTVTIGRGRGWCNLSRAAVPLINSPQEQYSNDCSVMIRYVLCQPEINRSELLLRHCIDSRSCFHREHGLIWPRNRLKHDTVLPRVKATDEEDFLTSPARNGWESR